MEDVLSKASLAKNAPAAVVGVEHIVKLLMGLPGTLVSCTESCSYSEYLIAYEI